jgi:hypothetical protein
MRRNAPLEQTIATLRSHGFTPIVERNEHYKVRWLGRDARWKMLVVSSTTVAYAAQRDAQHTLRRILRNDGVAA